MSYTSKDDSREIFPFYKNDAATSNREDLGGTRKNKAKKRKNAYGSPTAEQGRTGRKNQQGKTGQDTIS
jgi:hypothetical protein